MKQLIITLVFLAQSSLNYAQIISRTSISQQPYEKIELLSKKDTITYYLSETKEKKALPLLVYIQGSGANSHFIQRNDHIVSASGHSTFWELANDRYRVLIVEKPGVSYLQNEMTTAFDLKFSLESWSENLVKAIEQVCKTEKIDTKNIALAGHSEGGVVTARVAAILGNRVSKVSIMAGEGPSQLYSLYKFAESGVFFNTPEHDLPTPESRIEYVQEMWKDILADPKSTEKKFWGLTYLRWSSMLQTSVIDELTKFSGEILLIQGTADQAVHPESAVVAYNTLLSKGKNVSLRLLSDADHSFYVAKNPMFDGWKYAISQVVDWSFNF